MTPKHKARVDDIVKYICYPRWNIWVAPVTAERSEGTEKNFFEIGATTEQSDVDGSGYVWVRGFSPLLPEWANEATIIEAVFDLIERLQRHELREFLIYRGKRIFDPHKLPKVKHAGRKTKSVKAGNT